MSKCILCCADLCHVMFSTAYNTAYIEAKTETEICEANTRCISKELNGS